MIIAKTDNILTSEDYKKWHDLYICMANSGILMADGRFTLYNVDKNRKVEELKNNNGSEINN